VLPFLYEAPQNCASRKDIEHSDEALNDV